MLVHHLPYLTQTRIVLASASPRRSELLQSLGFRPEIIPSSFKENLDKSAFETPGDYARETSTHKAIEVSNRIKDKNSTPPFAIISADTVVEIEGTVLEKPEDEKDAFFMLSLLSGKTHNVYTGVSIIFPTFVDPLSSKSPLLHSFYEKTKVEFGQLEEKSILAYVKTKEPMDKAGAYGIQGVGGSLVKRIDGCFYNVMGFPLHRFGVELDGLISKGVVTLP